MARRYICSNCDGFIYSDEERCRQCGARNPYYSPTGNNRDASQRGGNHKKVTYTPTNYSQNNNTNNNTNNNSTNNNKSGGDGIFDFDLRDKSGCTVILIVILAIWFWPITLIYLVLRAIVKSSK